MRVWPTLLKPPLGWVALPIAVFLILMLLLILVTSCEEVGPFLYEPF